jgi:hypothetical protein
MKKQAFSEGSAIRIFCCHSSAKIKTLIFENDLNGLFLFVAQLSSHQAVFRLNKKCLDTSFCLLKSFE